MDIGIHSILKSASNSSSFAFHRVKDSLNCSRNNNSFLESSLRLVDEAVEELFIGESDVDDVSHDFEVLSWICKWSNEIFDDLVEDVADAIMVQLLDLLFVFSHGKLLQLSWVLDDLVHRFLLLVLVDVRLVLINAVSDDLVDLVVVSVMDSGLIEDVVLEVVWPLFRSNVDFGEAKHRDEAVLVQELILINLVPIVQWSAKRSESLDVSLSFSWPKSTDELQLVLKVLMVYQKIDVDTDVVHGLNVDLFKRISESSLIDMFLQRMKVQVESLVLTHD